MADFEQGRSRRRKRAVAVLPLGSDVVDLSRVGDSGQAAVGLESEFLFGDVIGRQKRITRHVELDFGGLLGHRFALHFGDRFGDHLAVQVVTDRSDVTRLRFAQQVAGTTNLEVAHGDLESRTKLGRLTDSAQPFVGLFTQHLVARVEQVGVCTLA